MPFKIVRNDITKMHADAIVNTANPQPVIGDGTDSAVYRAAGETQLLAERQKIGPIARGQAAITPAFRLHAKYIIHTVGPVWTDGNHKEPELLGSCYENSLRLARENHCESIAFPLISTGVYGFPKDLALQIVIRTVSRFLMENEMMIYLVVFDEKATRLSEKLFSKVEALIDDAYVEAKRQEEYGGDLPEAFVTSSPAPNMSGPAEKRDRNRIGNNIRDWYVSIRRRREEEEADACMSAQMTPELPKAFRNSESTSAPDRQTFGQKSGASVRSLEELMKQSDETFQQMLLRLIEEKGMTNAEAYKKANQDKKLFSKIKTNVNYQPNKKTAMAFALALELNFDEAKDLLARAGYAFSPSSNFDKVIRYCIETREYNIYEIEIILYDLGLDTLCNY